MIVGTLTGKSADAERFGREIDAIKKFYGIKSQRLETLLSSLSNPD